MLSYRPTYDVRNGAELLKKLKVRATQWILLCAFDVSNISMPQPSSSQEFYDEGLGGMRRDELLESYAAADDDIEVGLMVTRWPVMRHSYQHFFFCCL